MPVDGSPTREGDFIFIAAGVLFCFRRKHPSRPALKASTRPQNYPAQSSASSVPSCVTLDPNLAQFLFALWLKAKQNACSARSHELAWAYGWSEEAILRMSARRRSAYLEMLSA